MKWMTSGYNEPFEFPRCESITRKPSLFREPVPLATSVFQLPAFHVDQLLKQALFLFIPSIKKWKKLLPEGINQYYSGKMFPYSFALLRTIATNCPSFFVKTFSLDSAVAAVSSMFQIRGGFVSMPRRSSNTFSRAIQKLVTYVTLLSAAIFTGSFVSVLWTSTDWFSLFWII